MVVSSNWDTFFFTNYNTALLIDSTYSYLDLTSLINLFLSICLLPWGCSLPIMFWCLSPSAATWHLFDSAYSLCLDFLPGFTLLSHWPKQLYSSTNKSNTYTERPPASGTGINCVLKMWRVFSGEAAGQFNWYLSFWGNFSFCSTVYRQVQD